MNKYTINPFFEINKNILNRPRINKLLLESTEFPLTCIVAGTGYGKTQAVLSFLSTIDTNTIWIQLTDSDNYPPSFWNGFVQALSMVNKDISNSLLKYDFPYELSEFHNFLQTFSKEVYKDKNYVIVFDDCHIIKEAPISKFIENLVLANIENLNIFLLSRDPQILPYSGLINRSSIAYIDHNQLSFTHEELKAYFSLQNIKIDDSDLSLLLQQTNGWPFSLYLINLYIKRSGNLSSDPVTYTLPIIFEMIEQEVFSAYSANIQHCFIQLSLLNNFSIELIKELTEEHLSEMLSLLEDNMFISYNMQLGTYYFHQLFQDFLITKQVTLTTEEVKNVYMIAATWYKKNDALLDALLMYQKIHDNQEMWNIILKYVPGRFSESLSTLFTKIIQNFPGDFIIENPMTKVILACLHISVLDVHTVIKELYKVLEELQHMPITEKNITAIGEANILLASYHMILASPCFVTFFKKAVQCLPNGSTIYNESFLWVKNDYSFTLRDGHAGEMEFFINKIMENLPNAEKVLNGSAFGREHLVFAEANYLIGDFEKSTEHVYHAIYKGIDKNQVDIVCNGFFILTKIHIANGNYEEAVSFIKKIRSYAEETRYEDLFSFVDMVEGWFHIKMGNVDEVAPWLTDELLYDQMKIPLTISRERLIKALSLLAKHRYSELATFLEHLEITYQKRFLYFPLITLNILKAISYYHLERIEDSYNSFYLAYNMSYKNNISLLFIEFGTLFTNYIDHIKDYDQFDIPDEWIDSVYNKASTYEKRMVFAKAKYEEEHKKEDNMPSLTEREIEILQNLCEGLTRDEIADEFDLSISTVKYILKNIYSKLGAINGIDAARIATIKGIIK